MRINIGVITNSGSFSDKFLLIIEEDKDTIFHPNSNVTIFFSKCIIHSRLIFMVSFALERRSSLFFVRSKKIDAFLQFFLASKRSMALVKPSNLFCTGFRESSIIFFHVFLRCGHAALKSRYDQHELILL